jgi:acyl carrier protein
MNVNQIRATVLQVLSDVAPDADFRKLEPDVSFHDQLEIDSIDFLTLMMALEKALNVEIAQVDYPKLSTLRGCEGYLADKLAA